MPSFIGPLLGPGIASSDVFQQLQRRRLCSSGWSI